MNSGARLAAPEDPPMSRIGLLDDGVVYLISDDQPMAESGIHRWCMIDVADTLELWFRRHGRDDVLVGSNNFLRRCLGAVCRAVGRHSFGRPTNRNGPARRAECRQRRTGDNMKRSELQRLGVVVRIAISPQARGGFPSSRNSNHASSSGSNHGSANAGEGISGQRLVQGSAQRPDQ